MNEMQTFSSTEFGEIRTVQVNNEVWFVGKDIANALGYKNPTVALADNVEEVDKVVTKVSTLGGAQDTIVINESGMYSLMFGSRLEKAKMFKHWVTSEVIPAIRKTGSYNLPQTYQEALRALADKQDELERLEIINKELEPKGIFYDAVTQSDQMTSMADVAKILDMGIGRNKLFAILREKRILQPDNKPYQRYIDQGYFRLVEEKYDKSDGVGIYYKTVVKQKGIDFIRKTLEELI